MKRKILLVDDEKIILNALKADLIDNQYDVETAESGEKGIRKMKNKHFDLIITDLSLERMNGIEILRQARTIDPDIAVIILTGFGSLESAVEALRLGADDYLMKPCNHEELLFRINACLQKQEMNKKIKIYEEILPVCCVCKKIRDDNGKEPGQGKWMDSDVFLARKTGIDITHGYCPDCYEKSLKSLPSGK